MLFNSWEFAAFFTLVTCLYYALPHNHRWRWLLFTSSLFYMAFVPQYLLVLYFLIAIDYTSGRCLEATHGKGKKAVLVVSLLSNLGLLFLFKYFNFFNANLANLASFFHWNYAVKNLSLLLPLGLSFHTFQSMSYIFEVYRGNQKAERHLGSYALYILFYPQLVAGPIEKPQNLLPQLREIHSFDGQTFWRGLLLMAGGLFKKMVIADQLAVLVNPVFTQPTHYTSLQLLLAVYAFGFQVFFDFSGYSDIARGAAQTMGITLSLNFDRPFFSVSIAEFWTRWHMSLYRWFREYLYFPLALRSGDSILYQSFWLFFVFAISGLWHGASWTFIVWGALHGLYLVLARPLRPVRKYLAARLGGEHSARFSVLAMLMTFNLVSVTWIFFRAESLSDAWHIVGRLVAWTAPSTFHPLFFHFPNETLGLSVLLVVAALAVDFYRNRYPVRETLLAQPRWLRWSLYSIFLFLFIFLVERNQTSPRPFIYFEF